MTRRVRTLICAGVFAWLGAAPPSWAASDRDHPTVAHGLRQVVNGVVFVLPKTLLDATLNGPPIVGTAVGVIAGVSRAITTTVDGAHEVLSANIGFGGD